MPVYSLISDNKLHTCI